MTGIQPLLSMQGYQPYQGMIPSQMTGNPFAASTATAMPGMTGIGNTTYPGTQSFDSFSSMTGGLPGLTGMNSMGSMGMNPMGMSGSMNMMGGMTGTPTIAGSTLQLMSQITSMMASVMQGLTSMIQMIMQSVNQKQQSESTTETSPSDGTTGTNTSETTPSQTQETPSSTSTGESTPQMKKLAQKAEAVASRMGSTGMCLSGVRQALEASGSGNTTRRMSAYQKAEDFAKSDKYKEIKVGNAADLKKLPAGAIVVWNKKAGHPHGHISVALGDGREASDHIQKQITGYGSSFRVFLPQ